jgi:hypothetical protein
MKRTYAGMVNHVVAHFLTAEDLKGGRPPAPGGPS